MPWVKFSADFDFRVKHGVHKAYKSGMVQQVTTRCAKEAEQIGVADRTGRPIVEVAKNRDD